MKEIAKSWLHQVAERQQHNDTHFNNVYANLDISANTENSLACLQKLGIPAELVNKIHDCIRLEIDFALAAPNDEIVYFIGKKAMVCHGKKTLITPFQTEKQFEAGLKLTIIGHRELITGPMLNRISAYQIIVKNLQ